MTWIAQSSPFIPAGRPHVSRPPIWALIGAAAALLALFGFAVRGFSDNGFRFGSELAWRFTCLVYFAAVIAGPVMRLAPFRVLRRLCRERRQLVWGFCAGFGVYLASLVIPNTFPVPDRDGLTAAMTIFAFFAGLLILVIAYCETKPAAQFLGERISRTLVQVGMATFWLAYAAAGLSYISGPHRPDMFYGFSLSLMVIALLLRFADCLTTRLKALRQPA